MKLHLLVPLLLAFHFCYGQSELTDPETDCKYELQWTCEECTFSWTGDCLDNLPNGAGVLTVFNGGNEIMWYEGEMKNGKFDGVGSYRDEMNQMEGDLKMVLSLIPILT